MNSIVPVYVSVVFILTTLVTLYFFITATGKKRLVLLIVISWLVLQAILAFSEFYLKTDTIPPRFALMIVPPILLFIFLFLTTTGKRFLDALNQEQLTWIHSVRVPVELVLFWLFVYGQVPQLMTFEGRNFDIISGLTAPFIAVFGFRRAKISTKWLLLWNFICLVLLFNIVANAILSAPTNFQQFAFEQPNVGVMYFPFNWLPSFIVPVVLFAHCAQIRYLLKR
jgi:hypothetical protein